MHLGSKSVIDVTPKILFEMLDCLCNHDTVDMCKYGLGYLESSFISMCKVVPLSIACPTPDLVRVYFVPSDGMIPYEKTQINNGATFTVNTGRPFESDSDLLVAQSSFCPIDSYYEYLISDCINNFSDFLISSGKAVAHLPSAKILATSYGLYSG